jgi:hypothetical protein
MRRQTTVIFILRSRESLENDDLTWCFVLTTNLEVVLQD